MKFEKGKIYKSEFTWGAGKYTSIFLVLDLPEYEYGQRYSVLCLYDSLNEGYEPMTYVDVHSAIGKSAKEIK